MNKVCLIGRTTKEMELKQTQSGTNYIRFTLAVDRGKKREDGTRETDFISCIVWSKTAEVMAKYVKKGDRVAITGRIQTGNYTKDGATVYTTDVVLEDFYFMENKTQDRHEQGAGEVVNDDFAYVDDTLNDEGLPF